MAKAEPQPVARLWLTGEAMAQGQGYTLKSIEPIAFVSDAGAPIQLGVKDPSAAG